MRHVLQIRRIASSNLRRHVAVVADVGEGLMYGWPVDVALAEVAPGEAPVRPIELEILQVHLPVQRLRTGPGGNGYWMQTLDGLVHGFGTATFHGDGYTIPTGTTCGGSCDVAKAATATITFRSAASGSSRRRITSCDRVHASR